MTAPLTSGQRQAVEHILTSTHRFVRVEGHAGTGKTHMHKHAIARMTEQGFKVRAVAPYGNQARALRELGVETGTIAAMLKARDTERFALDDKKGCHR